MRNLTLCAPDRQKKQHEQLAGQLLGKNRNKKDRRASAPGPGPVAKPGSLASRIGVPKVYQAPLSHPLQNASNISDKTSIFV